MIYRPSDRAPRTAWTSVVVTTALGLVACSGGSDPDTVPSSSSASSSTTEGANSTSTDVASLPELDSFRTTPSDQFPVDVNIMTSGHPFKGRDATTPHPGAHVSINNSTGEWPRGGTDPASYPEIRAVADGIVTRVTASVREGNHDRYGLHVAIARSGTAPYEFEYRIEPMVEEPSPGFYADFITVREGDRVTKGEVIGYAYVPPGGTGAHLHFALVNTATGVAQAPAIFGRDVLREFYARWKAEGFDSTEGYTDPIAPCMGWKIAADENPFEAVAVECLQ